MVDRISKSLVKDYRAVFDENKNEQGEVEYRHLQPMLNKLGHDPDEMEMEVIYEELDIYCNGAFSLPHFLNLMASKFSKEEIKAKAEKKSKEEEELEEEMREAFRVFDADGNGFISQAELKHALINMGEKLSDEEIEDMMLEADKDGDGQVSFEEFCNMMVVK